MRFSAPRSTSPSPVRRRFRSQSTYGVIYDSSEDESDQSGSDAESVVSSASSDSFCYRSESEVPPPPPRPKRECSRAEQHYIEDTIASIRLRVNHYDAYEEWEKETKQESFRLARLEHYQGKVKCYKDQKKAHTEDAKRRAAQHQKQMEAVQSQLAALDLRRQNEERQLRERWNERNKRIWERIETVIKVEEAKVKAKLEAERKQKEEEERKRMEEEERKRQEEERKKREEEERQRKLQEEEDEKLRQEEAEKLRRQREEAELAERKALGFTTALDDWNRARDILRLLKAGPMKTVKADKALKSIWSAGRRAITPKIGQLTSDPQSIARISQQIKDIVCPPAGHPRDVYLALLSSLAKAILLQAETEVTAEKRSAEPIAHVAANLLGELEGFAEIFWAKLCQRAGGWPAPVVVPAKDSDGTPFEGTQRRKALGFRNAEESLSEYSMRVSGMMRVYFHILFVPVAQPLDPVFRLPRYWSYFARMLAEPQLLRSSVAASVLHAALDVGGAHAREIWGAQWVKLLERLYEGVTMGFHGSSDQLIGGKSSEGVAARVRAQLEVERILDLRAL